MKKISLLLGSILFGVASFADINYNELNSQLAIATYLIENPNCGDGEGMYSCETLNELTEQAETAKNSLEDASTQQEVDEQTALLESIIKDYAASITSKEVTNQNRKDLSTQISLATWIINTTKKGNNPGEYPKEQYNILYNAKQDAKEILSSETATEDDITNQIDALTSAIATYKSSQNPEIEKPIEEEVVLNTTALSLTIYKATTFLENTTCGSEIGQYSIAEYLLLEKETAAAKQTLASATTQKDIDSQDSVLTSVIKTYESSKITTAPEKDTTSNFNVSSLKSKIETTDYLLENTSCGTEKGQYSITEYINLSKIVAEAKEVLTNAESQEEINEQSSALETAINSYLNSVNTEDIDDSGESEYEIHVLANNDKFGTTYGSGSYYNNSIKNIIAVPESGYKFTGWNDGNNDNPRQITVTEESVYIAQFELNDQEITDSTTFSILAVSSDELLGTVLGTTGNIASGTKITLTAAVSYDGYHFTRWNDGNTDNPRQITVTEDKVYVAFFEKGTSTGIEENTLNYDIQIIGNQIVINNIIPNFVYDIQGRTIVNKNLTSGIFFVPFEGNVFKVFIR
ncbi:MAG: hypothetical protein MJ198_09395 [Bacteroidales bacterium]|nr:hypothetical protein [Bacteroidales bacterium]